MNPACIYDEDGNNYEDNEGGDYPINPFNDSSEDSDES